MNTQDLSSIAAAELLLPWLLLVFPFESNSDLGPLTGAALGLMLRQSVAPSL